MTHEVTMTCVLRTHTTAGHSKNWLEILFEQKKRKCFCNNMFRQCSAGMQAITYMLSMQTCQGRRVIYI